MYEESFRGGWGGEVAVLPYTFTIYEIDWESHFVLLRPSGREGPGEVLSRISGVHEWRLTASMWWSGSGSAVCA